MSEPVYRYAGNVYFAITFDKGERQYLAKIEQSGPVSCNYGTVFPQERHVAAALVPTQLEYEEPLAYDCVAQVLLTAFGIKSKLERKHPTCSCTNGYAAFLVDHEVLAAFRYDRMPETHEICGCDSCGAYQDDNLAFAQWIADGKPECH